MVSVGGDDLLDASLVGFEDFLDTLGEDEFIVFADDEHTGYGAGFCEFDGFEGEDVEVDFLFDGAGKHGEDGGDECAWDFVVGGDDVLDHDLDV